MLSDLQEPPLVGEGVGGTGEGKDREAGDLVYSEKTGSIRVLFFTMDVKDMSF
jgi:hypothetical protein